LWLCPNVIKGLEAQFDQSILDGPADDHVVIDDECVTHSAFSNLCNSNAATVGASENYDVLRMLGVRSGAKLT
jgi:hypothetical protein